MIFINSVAAATLYDIIMSAPYEHKQNTNHVRHDIGMVNQLNTLTGL